MRNISTLTSMVFTGKDYGYLIAVCEDGTVWSRVFPEARGESWKQIESISDAGTRVMEPQVFDRAS
jgi:hypothetical protein